jgi:glycosyltransferase involved in cell wall biosynthesis
LTDAEIVPIDIPTRVTTTSFPSHLSAYFRLKRQNLRFDAVHCISEPLSLVALAPKADIRVVSLHGTYASGNQHYKPFGGLYRRILKGSWSKVAVSKYTAGRAHEWLKSRDQPPVVELGVDHSVFYPPRAPEPLDEGPIVTIFVGSSKKRKGLLHAVRALTALAEGHTVELWHVGSIGTDRYSKECRDALDHFACRGTYRHFHDVDSAELRQLYAGATVSVLPSVNAEDGFEGFGLVHLEANACGTPCVGSRGCGNESAIEEGVSGYLAAQEDPGSIMEAILKAAALKRDPMSRQAVMEFARKYTWERYFTRIEQLYLDLLE